MDQIGQKEKHGDLKGSGLSIHAWEISLPQ